MTAARWLALLGLLLATPDAGAGERAEVVVVGLSDYHSHAVPFRSEGRPDQGGIARVVGWLKAMRDAGPALVLSGGDTLNAGTPTWSDEYRCVEWPWLDGLVDAMALGNHELDYGPDVFEQCRRSAAYPVLAANLRDEAGRPLLTAGGKPYLVRELAGRRIGAFAVAGPDMARLVKPKDLPPGARFTDPVEAARDVVATLRDVEKVDAVVMFGHQHAADDEALARAVPGIDLILGTHSHLRRPLHQVPGTTTWTLSPFQYHAYVSRVRLVFDGRRLASVDGGLVRMDESVPPDPDVARRVAELQAQLVARRPERFVVLGTLPVELSDVGLTERDTPIGNWATDVLRRAAGTRVFLSTASSFRAALGPGPVTVEQFFGAVPYPNRIVTVEMTGAQLAELVAVAESRRGTDSFSQQSGLRWTRREGTVANLEIEETPGRFAPVRPGATYRVATTDFQAFVAGGYKELFARVGGVARTDLDVHALLRDALARGDAQAVSDGRSGRPR